MNRFRHVDGVSQTQGVILFLNVETKAVYNNKITSLLFLDFLLLKLKITARQISWFE
jgi:hypothetical protein